MKYIIDVPDKTNRHFPEVTKMLEQMKGES